MAGLYITVALVRALQRVAGMDEAACEVNGSNVMKNPGSVPGRVTADKFVKTETARVASLWGEDGSGSRLYFCCAMLIPIRRHVCDICKSRSDEIFPPRTDQTDDATGISELRIQNKNQVLAAKDRPCGSVGSNG
jgi:hypothetical protein